MADYVDTSIMWTWCPALTLRAWLARVTAKPRLT